VIVLLIHLIAKPFEDVVDNLAETVSLAVLTLLSAVLGGQPFPMNSGATAGIDLLIYLPFAALFARLLVNRAHGTWLLKRFPILERCSATAGKQPSTGKEAAPKSVAGPDDD